MNKRKLFIIFIMIVFIVSVETASIATIKGTVNTETVRVRKEATTDSSIVKLVSIGDKITITGESGDWYKVKVDDVTGYIRKDLLDLDEDYPSNFGNNDGETNNNGQNENGNDNGNANVDEGNRGNENSGAGENSGENAENNNQNSEGNGENNNQGDNSGENNQDENANNNQGENNGNTVDTGNENAENPSESQGTTMGEDKTISTIALNEQEKTIGAKKKLQSEVNLKILPLANSNNILTVVADSEVTIVEIMNSWCKVETAEGESGWIRIDQ